MKKKHFKIVSFICLAFFFFIIGESCNKHIKIKKKYNSERRQKLKTDKPNLEYDSIYPEPVYKNLQMLGVVKKTGVHGQRNYGMILRCLRFQNITQKVEKKYGLPENILLAMIMQESGGADLLPNSNDDGGLGLCHMQPSVGKQFGLDIYQNCNKLVSKVHGKALRKIIEEYKYDKKQLIQFDDRFHPILNIDAAGRMLAFYASGKQFKETPAQTAIYRYAGSVNYSKYYKQVLLYMDRIKDKSLIDDVRNAFNTKNKHLTINGEKAGFDDYIKAHQEQNINYGLNDY